jgi:ribosomal protein L35
MPKIKTHKATAKRFKITSKGKLRRLKGRRSHLRR